MMTMKLMMTMEQVITHAFEALEARRKAGFAVAWQAYRDRVEEFYRDTLSEAALTRGGLSSSAVCEAAEVAYRPAAVFPDVLRLGEMKGEHLPILPLFYVSGAHKALALVDFSPDEAERILQNLCFRLLAALPAHNLKLHLVDPVGLGAAFAPLRNLAPEIIGKKILTEAGEIKRLLDTVKEQATQLVQNRLGSRYTRLRNYNADMAAHLAEPYQIVCIHNYPKGFSREAAEQLESLIVTGEKSGVTVVFSIDDDAWEQADKTCHPQDRYPSLPPARRNHRGGQPSHCAPFEQNPVAGRERVQACAL
ncbi:MAG: hypothetical protein LBR88_04085 [Zoogloeaceae bacterium]|jgi:hypothetical protein|nr:hypothetical protein [Zoogloeaceae bacterium]